MPTLPIQLPLKPRRYVSMRVHGTSGHVRIDEPDREQKRHFVNRLPWGIQITANYPTPLFALQFHIPTPLVIEPALGAIIMLPVKTGEHYEETSVFEGPALRVERVLIEFGKCKDDANARKIEVWDGGRNLLQPTGYQVPQPDPNLFSEKKPPYADLDMWEYDTASRLLYSGLGVTVNAKFNDYDENYLFVYAVRAIFSISGF